MDEEQMVDFQLDFIELASQLGDLYNRVVSGEASQDEREEWIACVDTVLFRYMRVMASVFDRIQEPINSTEGTEFLALMDMHNVMFNRPATAVTKIRERMADDGDTTD